MSGTIQGTCKIVVPHAFINLVFVPTVGSPEGLAKYECSGHPTDDGGWVRHVLPYSSTPVVTEGTVSWKS